MKYAFGSSSTKHIAVTNMPMRVDGDNLFDLPKGMHRHLAVRFRSVRFPEDELSVWVFLVEETKSPAQVLDVVERDAGNIITGDHPVKRV